MTKLLDQITLLARRWGTYVRVRHELEAYTDRELNDLGMSRADIGRIALEAASLVKPDATKRAREEDRRPSLLRQRFSPYL
jgi:uncharacterized protein YjiS (DUF1127 family)